MRKRSVIIGIAVVMVGATGVAVTAWALAWGDALARATDAAREGSGSSPSSSDQALPGTT